MVSDIMKQVGPVHEPNRPTQPSPVRSHPTEAVVDSFKAQGKDKASSQAVPEQVKPVDRAEAEKLAQGLQQLVQGVHRQLSFEVDVPDDVPAVLIDKDLMRIAVNNLLTNAIKYSNQGGTIRVRVEDDEDSVAISVEDDGIGIPDSEQAAIFEKFYRSQHEDARARGGQGLGLALAHEIVQLHHGSIRVRSRVGAGSKFTIDLWKHADIVQQAI